MTYLKAIAIAILIVFLIFLLLLFVFRPLVSYLSRPKNIKSSYGKGKELISQKGKTVIAVVAHPDDAEWYAGGTLALLAENNDVFLVMGTSGEKGGPANNLGKIREEKQKRAGKIIGYKEVIFLRHPDRGLIDNKQYRNELENIFRQKDADIILTFDPYKQSYIYHHPDHIAAGKASSEVAKKVGNITLYYFHSKDNDVIVDFERVSLKKRKALQILTDYGPPSIIFRILRTLMFRRDARFSYGINESFPEIGIQKGEIFRKTN